jgi:arylsulfatase A-like enzyme
MRRRVIVLISSVVVAGAASLPAGPPSAARTAADTDRPSFVVILTDDQRWDTLWAMPAVQRQLMRRGMTFANGFVVNSLCCPSRTSILTGQYSHSTGVWRNSGEFGGFGSFDDTSTVATWLDGAGYETALVGKYLNGYEGVAQRTQYIPPGWDRWTAFARPGYFDYALNRDGHIDVSGGTPAEYSTDVLADEAVRFIRQAEGPMFLMFSPYAPHGPSTPSTRYAHSFSDLEPWRPPSYNEVNVSDKPSWLQERPRWLQKRRAAIDARRTDMLRTLLSVDDAVRDIVGALQDTGRISNTFIVFTSDNGFHWGEHRLHGKQSAYEEAIRVPYVVRYDRLIDGPGEDEHLVLNIDLAPTIAALAGADAPEVDGRSLVPLLNGRHWRGDFLVEHMLAPEGGIPTYCAVRSERFSYVLYDSGEEELYDLPADPFQLRNVAGEPGAAGARKWFRARVAQLCDPAPPGFTFPF